MSNARLYECRLSLSQLNVEWKECKSLFNQAEKKVKMIEDELRHDRSHANQARLQTKQAELSFYGIESEFLEDFIRVLTTPAYKDVHPAILGGVCAKKYLAQFTDKHYQRIFAFDVLLGKDVLQAFPRRIELFTRMFRRVDWFNLSFGEVDPHLLNFILEHIDQDDDTDLLPRSLVSAATSELADLTGVITNIVEGNVQKQSEKQEEKRPLFSDTQKFVAKQKPKVVISFDPIDCDDELSPVPPNSKGEVEEFKLILRQLRLKEITLHNKIRVQDKYSEQAHIKFLDRVDEANQASSNISGYETYLKSIVNFLWVVSFLAGEDVRALKADITKIGDQSSAHKDLVVEVLSKLKEDECTPPLLQSWLFDPDTDDQGEQDARQQEQSIEVIPSIQSSNGWWSLFCCCQPESPTKLSPSVYYGMNRK